MPDISSKTLDHVPILAWGQSGDCTFIGAVEAATAATPYPADYQALMGATGLAFRVRWWQGPPEQQRWCPSSPVGETREESEAASRATGWPMRAEWTMDPVKEPGERLVPMVRENIDKGLPVLAYDDQMNVSVLYGYEDGGRTSLLRSYSHGAETLRLPTESLKMFVLFLEEHKDPLRPLETALLGLRMGVWNFRRGHDPEDDEARGYWHGPLALQKWAEDIGKADTFTEDERNFLFFVSWWNFEGLADARRNAGPFLRQSVPLFPPEARIHLENAAGLYDEESCLLLRSFTQKDAFLGPWAGEGAHLWTDAVRQREQEMLACATSIEENAITEIETALAYM